MKRSKKIMAVMVAMSCMGSLTTALPQLSAPVFGAEPNNYGWYFNYGFESSTDGFTARGPASIASSSDTAFVGSKSLYVSGRKDKL